MLIIINVSRKLLLSRFLKFVGASIRHWERLCGRKLPTLWLFLAFCRIKAQIFCALDSDTVDFQSDGVLEVLVSLPVLENTLKISNSVGSWWPHIIRVAAHQLTSGLKESAKIRLFRFTLSAFSSQLQNAR
jgi:hypothetical protein